MMRRLLPVSEWPRLIGTELETIWPILDRETARVIVVEDDYGNIIGAWAGFPLFHAEGVSIRRDHQGKGAVARLLLDGMRQTALEAGYRSVITASLDPVIDVMLERLGAVALPGQHYSVPLVETPTEKVG